MSFEHIPVTVLRLCANPPPPQINVESQSSGGAAKLHRAVARMAEQLVAKTMKIDVQLSEFPHKQHPKMSSIHSNFFISSLITLELSFSGEAI